MFAERQAQILLAKPIKMKNNATPIKHLIIV
jgi:hypothetical protein